MFYIKKNLIYYCIFPISFLSSMNLYEFPGLLINLHDFALMHRNFHQFPFLFTCLKPHLYILWNQNIFFLCCYNFCAFLVLRFRPWASSFKTTGVCKFVLTSLSYLSLSSVHITNLMSEIGNNQMI
jgi:hypothetical protein